MGSCPRVDRLSERLGAPLSQLATHPVHRALQRSAAPRAWLLHRALSVWASCNLCEVLERDLTRRALPWALPATARERTRARLAAARIGLASSRLEACELERVERLRQRGARLNVALEQAGAPASARTIVQAWHAVERCADPLVQIACLCFGGELEVALAGAREARGASAWALALEQDARRLARERELWLPELERRLAAEGDLEAALARIESAARTLLFAQSTACDAVQAPARRAEQLAAA